MSKIFYTLAEAAQELNCSRGFLLLEVKRGNLNAAKIGRGWKILDSDLAIYINKKFEENGA